MRINRSQPHSDRYIIIFFMFCTWVSLCGRSKSSSSSFLTGFSQKRKPSGKTMNLSNISNFVQNDCFKAMPINTDGSTVDRVFAANNLYNSKLPFPLKLHALLDEVAKHPENDSIISWQPHGMAFRIHDPKKFANSIMPRYFSKNTKYKSFQRQLHIYDFYRIKTGADAGSYYHKLFIRGQPSTSLGMERRKIKGADGMTKSFSDHDITFYTHLDKLNKTKETMMSKLIEKSMDEPRQQLFSIDPIACHSSTEAFQIEPEDVFSIVNIQQSQPIIFNNKSQCSYSLNGTEMFDKLSTKKEDYEPFRLFEGSDHGREVSDHGREVSFGGRKFFCVEEKI